MSVWKIITYDLPLSETTELTVSNHIWSDYLEMAEDILYTPKYKNCMKNEKKQ